MGDTTIEAITGGQGRPFIVTTSFDLGDVGYEQAEYAVAGEARAFRSTTPLRADGRWDVEPSSEHAAYRTRIVVHRPIAAADFDGTVVVEWCNVSAGLDTAPDWLSAHNMMLREGAVWVGVSAQAVGVQGGLNYLGALAEGGLRAFDPERYAALHHPGDSFSYDMFAAVGALARDAGALGLPDGAAVERVLAIGESQSAFRLVTYVNGVHPVTPVYDGFLVHSRGGSGAPLTQEPLPEVTVTDGTVIRDDLDVPVLVFQTETDLTALGSVAARQPDTDHLRLWEVAGTAHADIYTAMLGFDDVGQGAAEARLLDVHAIDGGPLGCERPVNAGPAYAVLQAALHALLRWVRDGTAPPSAPRLELAGHDPAVIARDGDGNAIGGIRTPLVDAPLAALRGDGNGDDPGSFCRLFGTTAPFDAATLANRYGGPEGFAAAFTSSAEAAVAAGFLLPEEAGNLGRAATGGAAAVFRA